MKESNIIKKIIIYLLLLCFAIIQSEMIVKANEQTISLNMIDYEVQESQVFDNSNETSSDDSSSQIDALKNMVGSVLIEIVGAFLGFLSAIAFAKRSDKQQMKELNSSLYNELLKIYKELILRLEDEELEDYYHYQTTIWDISLASGTLALVANSKIYKKYIQIYSMIQYAQELESEYTHAKLFADLSKDESFAIRYINTIGIARKREAKNICDHIENNILEEVDKCQEKR